MARGLPLITVGGQRVTRIVKLADHSQRKSGRHHDNVDEDHGSDERRPG